MEISQVKITESLYVDRKRNEREVKGRQRELNFGRLVTVVKNCSEAETI